MLVLTRKLNETITIGSDIVIRVMKTGKGRVRIGIEAPESTKIMRGEAACFETEMPAEELESDTETILDSDLDPDLESYFELCTLDALLVQN